VAGSDKQSAKKKQPYWLVYLALLIGGALMIAYAYQIMHLDRWTARIGIALMYSAIALLVGNGRWTGFMATAIVWLAVVATYIL
jgi:hypothetical protein